ncbi:hypothetical protein [Pseudomonas sp. JAI120]|uniref:hypothetical protein n=1 Tax=Pseudomonas sp. JAI120 TaxID=2723063 RepID=UPI0030D9C863
MRYLTLLPALLLVGFTAMECAASSAYPKQPMNISQMVINEISEKLTGTIRKDFQVLALLAFSNPASNTSRAAPIYRVAYRPGRAIYVSAIKSFTQKKETNVLYWETSVTKLLEKETAVKYRITLSLAKCKEKSSVPLYDVSFAHDGSILSTYIFSEVDAVPITEGAIDEDMLAVVCGSTNEADAVNDPLMDAAGLFGEYRSGS